MKRANFEEDRNWLGTVQMHLPNRTCPKIDNLRVNNFWNWIIEEFCDNTKKFATLIEFALFLFSTLLYYNFLKTYRMHDKIDAGIKHAKQRKYQDQVLVWSNIWSRITMNNVNE